MNVRGTQVSGKVASTNARKEQCCLEREPAGFEPLRTHSCRCNAAPVQHRCNRQMRSACTCQVRGLFIALTKKRCQRTRRLVGSATSRASGAPTPPPTTTMYVEMASSSMRTHESISELNNYTPSYHYRSEFEFTWTWNFCISIYLPFALGKQLHFLGHAQ